MSFFEGTSSLRWYALKVFYRRYAAICATLNRDGVEYFIPPLRPDCMLMFVRTTSDYIAFLQKISLLVFSYLIQYFFLNSLITCSLKKREDFSDEY